MFRYQFSMMGIFYIVFCLVFLLVLAIIIIQLVRGLAQWNRNNHAPCLTVDASVITKRMAVTHRHHSHAGNHTAAHGMRMSNATHYYVTFQFASGDRLELHVPGQEYGLLAEGDCGKLTFQGTRYLGFIRNQE